MSGSRYLHNDLDPVSLDNESLASVLSNFQAAIAGSVQVLLEYVKSNKNRPATRDSLYTGDPGIAVMFLRLAAQFDAAGLGDALGQDIRVQTPTIISRLLPEIRVQNIKSGHLSPLDSPVGSTLVHVLMSLHSPSARIETALSTEADEDWSIAMKNLDKAVHCAVEDDSLGGDEVLYGRAGLLWAMLNLRLWLDTDISSNKRADLERVASKPLIGEVIEEILEAGDTGAALYVKHYGEASLPLMWPWYNKFYLGAVHGVAGILTVLLQAPRDLITPHMRLITKCISGLCNLTLQHDGHLPSSLPEKPRGAGDNLVQICHGSPGLLLLLATFRTRFPGEWKEEWDEAEILASDTVWKEGLVRKGIGVCHGLTGNAWTFLAQAHAHKKTKEADVYLSRALSILLLSTECPPLTSPSDKPSLFRTPDHPLSLFEGLAGAICAWVDACVIIRERLGELGDDSNTKRTPSLLLGLPGLGGMRAHGYF